MSSADCRIHGTPRPAVSQCRAAAAGRTDPNHVRQRRHEHLAVANASGSRRGRDYFDRPVHLVVVDRQLDLEFRQEVDRVFRPAVLE
jgi:hypothetical protein